jgi:hypothetical protein
MKFFMTFLAALLLSLTFTVQTLSQQEKVSQVADKPVYVYFIFDPQEEKWFKRNMFGLIGWGDQNEAEVWTVRKSAERMLGEMYGARADLPAKDDR